MLLTSEGTSEGIASFGILCHHQHGEACERAGGEVLSMQFTPKKLGISGSLTLRNTFVIVAIVAAILFQIYQPRGETAVFRVRR